MVSKLSWMDMGMFQEIQTALTQARTVTPNKEELSVRSDRVHPLSTHHHLLRDLAKTVILG